MDIFRYIKGLLDSTKKVLRDHAGKTLCVTASVAVAAGAYLLTLPASAPVTVIYALGSIVVVSGGGAVFSIGVLSGRENDSSAIKQENSEVENLIQEVASLKANFKVLDGDNKILNQKLAVALNESLLAKKDVGSVRSEQTKLSNTLSASSVNLSRVEISTNDKFKKLETRSDSFDERLSDLDEDVKALSKKIKSSLQAGLRQNGIFTHEPETDDETDINDEDFDQETLIRGIAGAGGTN